MSNRTSEKIAFIFPGQGAQYVGMGKSFVERFSIAQATFDKADKYLGFSLSQLIFEGPVEELTLTHNSQIAIYVVCIAIWRVIRERFSDCVPVVTAGLSVGEYAALTASGRMDFEDGLALVRARGLYMNEASIRHPGTMAACLGIDVDVVREVIDSLEGVWIANLNCPGQVVISGTFAGVEKASAILKNRGAKKIIPLDVSGPFHSGLMHCVKKHLKNIIEKMTLYPSTVSLVMNVPGDFVQQESKIRHYLIDQVVCPVYWERSILKIKERGVGLFIEIGCGKTLAGINHKIKIKAPTLSVETVEDLQKINRAIC